MAISTVLVGGINKIREGCPSRERSADVAAEF